MKQQWVMGNWKMNGRLETIDALLKGMTEALTPTQQAQCVIFPPSIYIPRVQSLLSNTSIRWGAQNCYPEDNGAFTGELSTPMLTDFNCHFVLVGHSERRHLFEENENFVAKKFHHAKLHGMIPVLCVGETLEQREKGMTEAVIERQLRAVIDATNDVFDNTVIAYEPVWAIGTGKTATAEQAQHVHAFIRRMTNEHASRPVSILYGGSVNEKNARDLFEMPDVDGGLVGGASLNAQQFVEIVKCIS